MNERESFDAHLKWLWQSSHTTGDALLRVHSAAAAAGASGSFPPPYEVKVHKAVVSQASLFRVTFYSGGSGADAAVYDIYTDGAVAAEDVELVSKTLLRVMYSSVGGTALDDAIFVQHMFALTAQAMAWGMTSTVSAFDRRMAKEVCAETLKDVCAFWAYADGATGKELQETRRTIFSSCLLMDGELNLGALEAILPPYEGDGDGGDSDQASRHRVCMDFILDVAESPAYMAEWSRRKELLDRVARYALTAPPGDDEFIRRMGACNERLASFKAMEDAIHCQQQGLLWRGGGGATHAPHRGDDDGSFTSKVTMVLPVGAERFYRWQASVTSAGGAAVCFDCILKCRCTSQALSATLLLVSHYSGALVPMTVSYESYAVDGKKTYSKVERGAACSVNGGDTLNVAPSIRRLQPVLFHRRSCDAADEASSPQTFSLSVGLCVYIKIERATKGKRTVV